jgi:hypothetical protein
MEDGRGGDDPEIIENGQEGKGTQICKTGE